MVAEVKIICLNPECDNEVVRKGKAGQARLYCSRRCTDEARLLRRNPNTVRHATCQGPDCNESLRGIRTNGNQRYCSIRCRQRAWNLKKGHEVRARGSCPRCDSWNVLVIDGYRSCIDCGWAKED